MGKRPHALDHFTGTLSTSYRLAIDNPGWAEALYVTLAEVAALISTHSAVTIANPANGLAIDVNQVLSIQKFDGSEGVVPTCETVFAYGTHAGAFMNAEGDWILLVSSGLLDAPAAIVPPSADGNFALDEGKLLFGANETTPLGTSSLYSDTAGEIKTDEMITSALGFKAGTGSTLLEIGVETTLTMIATGDYLPISIKEGGIDKIVYIPTFVLDI